MKRFVQLLLRLFTALVIAGFVAFAQYALWEWANRSDYITDAEQEVKGFAYAGYQRHQSPLTGSYPSEEELAGDVDLLANYTNRLRTYSSLDNAAVVPLAGFRGLKVTNGIWLDRDEEKNAREVEAGIQLARQYKHVERIIVGNESILRNDMKPETLIPLLQQVKKATRKPVSTAEPWHVWLKYPELVKHVDFITVHLLPYHEGVPADKALEYAMQRYDELAAAFPKKKILIGEIGWPSRGPVIGGAVPSRANEAQFIRNFLASERTLKLDYFIMEAIDQPWKVELEGWAGAYWGVFNAERELKFSLEGAVPRDIRWQEQAYNASLYAFVP
ncbi:MAG: glycosyl hydrolase family 17 protein, partial [Azovibrio sp.]|nr:glycosyl hydrolase family 17 protein [Azovibrio sp.]